MEEEQGLAASAVKKVEPAKIDKVKVLAASKPVAPFQGPTMGGIRG